RKDGADEGPSPADTHPDHQARRGHSLIGKGARSASCSGGHVGGQYVIGVSVEVLAGAVVAPGGAWVGVVGGDLDVAETDAGGGFGGLFAVLVGREPRQGRAAQPAGPIAGTWSLARRGATAASRMRAVALG